MSKSEKTGGTAAEPDDLITRAEAAKLAGVGIRTIDRWRGVAGGTALLVSYRGTRRGRREAGRGWVLVRRSAVLEIVRPRADVSSL